MGTHKPDNWDNPRTQANKLTAAEIARIRVAFNVGRRPSEIAAELPCSLRTANKYYAQFRGPKPKADSLDRVKPVCQLPEPRPMPAKSRFYTSNFEL